MLKDDRIMIGKADNQEVSILLNKFNRHGLIAGATGTGKTVTLKVIAESLSEAGIPTFITDIKGDLTGMAQSGDLETIQGRLDSMGIEDYKVNAYPVRYFDLFRQHGIPVRTILQDMSPLLLGRILELSDAQMGVLTIAYQYAQDEDLELIDLGDLQALIQYLGEHYQDVSLKYGNVTKQSASAIQRKLLQFQQQKGDLFFGMPALNVFDLFETKQGMGYMNLLECDELFQHPLLYSTFLLWLLDAIYNELGEVGDLAQPKFVMFFDEAHLLFDDASKPFLEQLERMVRLIRSKGAGIYFCTQAVNDIPQSILNQLSTRIQHAVRAYTPAELKNTKAIADSFRVNPEIDTLSLLTEMKTGYALVSTLDEDGAPTMVQHTKILPPHSSMQSLSQQSVQQMIHSDSFYDMYKDDIDPESAAEKIQAINDAVQKQKEQEKQDQADEKKRLEAEKKKQKNRERMIRKVTNKAENEVLNFGMRSAKKILKGLFK